MKNEERRMNLKQIKLFMMIGAVSALSVLAVEFPNPADFNPSWESAKPGISYSTDLPTSAMLGNGSLGAVNAGDGNHKHFVLTRGDLWSCGDFTPGKDEKNIGPISFAEFEIGPGMYSVKSTDTLDLTTATLVTEGGFGKGKVRLETYVASSFMTGGFTIPTPIFGGLKSPPGKGNWFIVPVPKTVCTVSRFYPTATSWSRKTVPVTLRNSPPARPTRLSVLWATREWQTAKCRDCTGVTG